MYDQLDSMQTAVDNAQDIPVFGYNDDALDDNTGIEGHNAYSDLNNNNIPLIDGTGLSLQEIEKGFRGSLSSLSRSFFTHFFGRSSFNTNKLKQLMSDVLGTYKADYAHNFRKWDSTATYSAGDVCFLVANGIRYCFKSKVNNNTSTITAAADGTLSYTAASWLLLTEQRTVRHPIGKPFLWLSSTLPSGGYICFSDGGRYPWSYYPKLDTPEFRALLTRYTYWGARANDVDFTVPTINELYPISSADMQNTASVIGARVPGHYHNLNTITPNTTGTVSTGHYHTMNSSNNAGSHQHYTGDYRPRGGGVSNSEDGYHEDSKFYATETTVSLTPTLDTVSFGAHHVDVPEKSYSHTHPVMTSAPSGAGDFDTASDKYRPGTVKAMLAVRAD